MKYDKQKLEKFLTKVNKYINSNSKLSVRRIVTTDEYYYNYYKKQTVGHKPEGIWTSGKYGENEKSWLNWTIKNDMYDWINPKKHKYAIITFNKKTMLTINTISKVKQFYNKYKIKLDNIYLINWKKVQEDGYDGVNFSKYYRHFENDIKYRWYVMLDCACQCIWNGSIIKNVQTIN